MTVSAHVLAAALTAVSANGSRISETSMRAALEAALAVLKTPQGDTSLDLQPGEKVLIIQGRVDDGAACAVDEFNTLEDAHRHVVDIARDGKQTGWNNEDFTDDDFELVIVRHMSNVSIETEPKVTFR